MRNYFLIAAFLITSIVIITKTVLAETVVTVALPDGAPTNYYIGETLELKIQFNERVHLSAGVIHARVNGYDEALQIQVDGAAEGEYKQLYNASVLINPDMKSGKVEITKLEGIALLEDGSAYYDDSKDSIIADSTMDNLSIDTIELEWTPKVFIGDEIVSAENNVARQGQMVKFQLFTMNIGDQTADYFGENIELMLNADGQWAQFNQAIPLGETRNGIDLKRYLYEFRYIVPQNTKIDGLTIEGVIRLRESNHNGSDFVLELPAEVQTQIRNLNILVDSQSYDISASPASDTNPANRDRQVIVDVSDPSGADATDALLYYRWALEGSFEDNYFIHVGNTNGIASGQPVPITEQDIVEDGNYNLYVRAVDSAGNTRIERFGPYNFDISEPSIRLIDESGMAYDNYSRFNGADNPFFIVQTEETVTSVTYEWSGIAAEAVAYESGPGTWTIGQGLPDGEGEYDLYITSTDSSTNQSNAAYTFIRDRSVPTVTGELSQIDLNQVFRSLEIPLVIENETLSGDSYEIYQLWNHSAIKPHSADPGWEQLDSSLLATSPPDINGEVYLHIKIVDKVGNEGIYTNGDGFTFDNVAPELEMVNIACSQVYERTISVECGEAVIDPTPINGLQIDLQVDGKTGVELADYYIEYYLTSKPKMAYTNVYPATGWKQVDYGQLDISGAHGELYILFKITDPVGNAKMFLTNGYTFDVGTPEGTVAFTKKYTNMTPVELQVNAAEDAVEMRYSFDGTNFTEYATFINGASQMIDLPVDQTSGEVLEQSYTIYVEFLDAAGNQSGSTVTDTITYDITPPTFDRIEYTSDDSGTVTASVYYSDDVSPLNGLITRTFTENGSLEVDLSDDAGNRTPYTIVVDSIDRNGPAVTFSQRGNMTPARFAEAVVMVSDEEDGLDQTSLSYVWLDEYMLPNAGEIGWQPFTNGDTLSLSEVSGTWYLFVKAKDDSGNETIERSDAFLLDNIGPEAYISYSFNLDSQQQMPLTTAGPIMATVKANNDFIYYDGKVFDYTFGKDFVVTHIVKVELDGSETPLYGGENCPDYLEGDGCPSSIVFAENTDQIYRFYTVDSAGNVSTVDTRPISVIDPAFPKIHVTENPSTPTNQFVDVTVSVDSTDRVTTSLKQIESDGELIKVVLKDGTTIEDPLLLQDVDLFATDLAEITFRFASEDYRGYINYFVDYELNLYGMYEYEVQNLDQSPPDYQVLYSLPELSETEIPKYPSFYTNRDVTVRVMPEDQEGRVTFISQGGAVHTFTQNGTHTFIFQDEAGNTVEVPVTIDRIIKDGADEPIVTFDPPSWTNQSVTATINFDYDDTGRQIQLVGTTGWISTTEMEFEENGSRTIQYQDQGGNHLSLTVTVDWIDKIAPLGTVEYSRDDEGNVIATLIMSDNSGETPIVTDADGIPVENGETFTFYENGQHTFYFRDAAGNMNYVIAEATDIDKEGPDLEITYSNQKAVDSDHDGIYEYVQMPTNGDVRITIHASEPVRIINPMISDQFSRTQTYDVTKNANIDFIVEDRSGNTKMINGSVYSIDRDAPVPVVSYSTETLTKDNVIATVSANEKIRVLNNGGRTQHTFRENGVFTFVVEDEAGNVAEIVASVDWIDKSKVEYELHYDETAPTKNDVTVTIHVVTPGRGLTRLDGSSLPTITFQQNGVRWLEAKDELDNRYLIEVRVSNIDKKAPEILFAGDLLIPVNGTVNALDGVTVDDNLDGNLSDEVQVINSTIDTSVPGEYAVEYEVTDTAGNTATAVRKAMVIDSDQLSVYINNQLAEEVDMIRGNKLAIQTFGTKGEYTIWWKYGKWLKGDFKTGDKHVYEGELTIDRQGYYTFLVQDQERHYKLVQVYVIP